MATLLPVGHMVVQTWQPSFLLVTWWSRHGNPPSCWSHGGPDMATLLPVGHMVVQTWQLSFLLVTWWFRHGNPPVGHMVVQTWQPSFLLVTWWSRHGNSPSCWSHGGSDMATLHHPGSTVGSS